MFFSSFFPPTTSVTCPNQSTVRHLDIYILGVATTCLQRPSSRLTLRHPLLYERPPDVLHPAVRTSIVNPSKILTVTSPVKVHNVVVLLPNPQTQTYVFHRRARYPPANSTDTSHLIPREDGIRDAPYNGHEWSAGSDTRRRYGIA